MSLDHQNNELTEDRKTPFLNRCYFEGLELKVELPAPASSHPRGEYKAACKLKSCALHPAETGCSHSTRLFYGCFHVFHLSSNNRRDSRLKGS